MLVLASSGAVWYHRSVVTTAFENLATRQQPRAGVQACQQIAHTPVLQADGRTGSSTAPKVILSGTIQSRPSLPPLAVPGRSAPDAIHSRESRLKCRSRKWSYGPSNATAVSSTASMERSVSLRTNITRSFRPPGGTRSVLTHTCGIISHVRAHVSGVRRTCNVACGRVFVSIGSVRARTVHRKAAVK